MKKTRGFLLTVGILLATAFTLSCSSDGDPNSGNDKGNDIKNYKTKIIGNQTWMAENLNYAVKGSRCYKDDPANCAKYGRLYDWATAMALPPNCNSASCAIQPKHQGICPDGWHIPSIDDWKELFHFADGWNDEEGPDYYSPTAGRKLKAKSGWNDYHGNSGNGTDGYEFSALPGGGFSDGYFGIGDYGFWWIATEHDSKLELAYLLNMYYNQEYALWDYGDKSGFLSVRCLKN